MIPSAAYTNILNFINGAVRSHRGVSVEDAIRYDLSYETLTSIYSQVHLRFAEQTFHKLNSFEKIGIMNNIFHRIRTGESIFAINREYHFGGYKMTKSYLEATVSPECKVAEFLNDPSIVPDALVRQDLLHLIAEDNGSSIAADLIKETTGKDYENLLVDLLTARKMCFETEDEAREKGKPKTPDVLFLIPMAIAKNKYDPVERHHHHQALSSADVALGQDLQSTRITRPISLQMQASDYVVVNWIDSKAMFADRITFTEHLKQLESYRNRYGRGMVIYWHGCVEDVFYATDDMILVRTEFPDDWLFPTGEPADGRDPLFDLFSSNGSAQEIS